MSPCRGGGLRGRAEQNQSQFDLSLSLSGNAAPQTLFFLGTEISSLLLLFFFPPEPTACRWSSDSWPCLPGWKETSWGAKLDPCGGVFRTPWEAGSFPLRPAVRASAWWLSACSGSPLVTFALTGVLSAGRTWRSRFQGKQKIAARVKKAKALQAGQCDAAHQNRVATPQVSCDPHVAKCWLRGQSLPGFRPAQLGQEWAAGLSLTPQSAGGSIRGTPGLASLATHQNVV